MDRRKGRLLLTPATYRSGSVGKAADLRVAAALLVSSSLLPLKRLVSVHLLLLMQKEFMRVLLREYATTDAAHRTWRHCNERHPRDYKELSLIALSLVTFGVLYIVDCRSISISAVLQGLPSILLFFRRALLELPPHTPIARGGLLLLLLLLSLLLLPPASTPLLNRRHGSNNNILLCDIEPTDGIVKWRIPRDASTATTITATGKCRCRSISS